MQTEILIYDGVDELDAIGPFEVLSPLTPKLVTLKPTATVTASHGMTIVPHAALAEAPGLLIVPGGGWVARNEQTGAYAEYLRGDIPAAIAERHARRSIIASVCTGAMLLAKAGLLDGRPAVTHHAALDDLRASGADVQPHARWVDDGDILTAGGGASGLDLALHLLERILGAQAAEKREHVLEHRRIDIAPTAWGHRSP
ncbi:MAG: DJ-1/PfpI family protein [Solirubrobacteraceae bacterium]|jgi:transcriptional regulator GlxA family with amidase domain